MPALCAASCAATLASLARLPALRSVSFSAFDYLSSPSVSATGRFPSVLDQERPPSLLAAWARSVDALSGLAALSRLTQLSLLLFASDHVYSIAGETPGGGVRGPGRRQRRPTARAVDQGRVGVHDRVA